MLKKSKRLQKYVILKIPILIFCEKITVNRLTVHHALYGLKTVDLTEHSIHLEGYLVYSHIKFAENENVKLNMYITSTT